MEQACTASKADFEHITFRIVLAGKALQWHSCRTFEHSTIFDCKHTTMSTWGQARNAPCLRQLHIASSMGANGGEDHKFSLSKPNDEHRSSTVMLPEGSLN